MKDDNGSQYKCVVSYDGDVPKMAGRAPGQDFLVYSPAEGPGLEEDLTVRGRFWSKEDAEIFAASLNEREHRSIEAPIDRLSLHDQRCIQSRRGNKLYPLCSAGEQIEILHARVKAAYAGTNLQTEMLLVIGAAMRDHQSRCRNCESIKWVACKPTCTHC